MSKENYIYKIKDLPESIEFRRKKEEEEIRKTAFEGYQVNENLLDMASKNVKFMHDLPAHPNEEISENLLYDERSIVFTQSENRMWSQMALIEKILKRK